MIINNKDSLFVVLNDFKDTYKFEYLFVVFKCINRVII